VSYGTVQLGDLLRIRHGFAFKSEFFEPAGEDLVLTPGNFEIGGGLQLRDRKDRFYSGPFSEDFRLKAGDLLIAMTDLTQGAPILGSPLVIPETGCFLHNQRLGKVVDLDESRIDRGYLYFLFAWDGVRAQLRASATGATVRHTAPERIYRASVPLPSLSTQRKIVSVLSAYDDLIENNRRRIKLLEEIAQRIYREWFVDFRYPGHGDVPLVESEVGDVPHAWSVQPFSALGDYVNGYAFKPSDWGTIGHPIDKIRELKGGVTSDTPRYAGTLPDKFRVEDGDLLFSWSADLDAYLWNGGRAWLNQHLFRVDPAESINKAFLFHSLRERMGEFRARAQGTTMRHIKRSALSQVLTVVPIENLMDRFGETAMPLDSQVLCLTRTNQTLREARDRLLPRLISGEVDVEDLDIAEEEAAA
jgi:type I restriction enzyme S subunit